MEEDFVAWHPDKRGIFSVKSAFCLGLQEMPMMQNMGSSSSRPDGRRPAWDLIWKNPAPPKVRIFAWKAALEALATEEYQCRLHISQSVICKVCGNAMEDAHHALIWCPHAVGLWNAMRGEWDIPKADQLKDGAPDWLSSLLEKLSDTQRLICLMIMWRAWHVRNEVTH